VGRLHRVSEAVVEGTFSRSELEALIQLGYTPQTFQSYMQFKEIPYKLIVAKRLAQCLNPALPTGVHQRALDVYTHILSVLGVSVDVVILW
jgi:hypothetical protein